MYTSRTYLETDYKLVKMSLNLSHKKIQHKLIDDRS